MGNSFNIQNLFTEAFGYQPPADTLDIPAAPARTKMSKKGQPFYADDIYGREFFMPVKFIGTLQAGATLVPFEYQVPFAIISISRKKTIIKTPLVEREGSVKELINTEDCIINIKGIIVRPDNEWPEDEISDLEKLFSINQSIGLRSALTDIFLKGEFEHKVVIDSINFPGNPGVQHAKPFEMNCESDSIFTLELE